LCCLWPVAARAGLKVYYVRHAEGGHQVVGEWLAIPRPLWPVYVGNGDMLTPRGDSQATALSLRLQHDHFDFIAVSPYLRCQKTIRPYLTATRQKAEIWPELAEISGSGMGLPMGSLPPSSANLNDARPIDLLDNDTAHFALRPDAPNWLDFASSGPQAASDYHVAITNDILMIRSRFGTTNKSILLVGHTEAGKWLLRTLLNNNSIMRQPSPYGTVLNNTGMWMAEQQKDGSFKLRILNDRPYPPSIRLAPHPKAISAIAPSGRKHLNHDAH
jgi:broad specificity phosphatase PhoE